MSNGSVLDAEVALHNRARHSETLLFVRVTLEVVPPVTAHHDGELRAWGSVLALDGSAVEDDTESALGVLVERNGLRNQIAETFDGEEGGVLIIEVDGHDGDIGRQLRIAEGGNDDVVVLGGLVVVRLD
jgi:hypothetical protein